MSKLWEVDRKLDASVEAYTVGTDPHLDVRLLPYEVLGSIAHAAGLVGCGVLTRKEFHSIRVTLKKLHESRSSFKIRRSQEDIHTAVEQHLTRKLGPVGQRVHTGRSRNDQVQVDLRLYLKDRLLELVDATLQAARSWTAFGKKHQKVLLPGYTHTQRAMPTTLGHWAAAHAEALIENTQLLRQTFIQVDRSPLGSAAGYGVGLSLDRGRTAKLLGFRSTQRNTLRVQTSRPWMEAAVVSALTLLARDLGVLASDLILTTTVEFGFMSLSAEVCTGSSIMPQKKNPDVLELTRARAALFPGWFQQILSLSGLSSGYHRDYQLTKDPLFRALDCVREMLAITGLLPAALSVNRQACSQALDSGTLATQRALDLVAQGVPFRQAYRQIAAQARKSQPAGQAIEDIRLPTYSGAPGNPDFKSIEADRREQASWQRKTRRQLDKTWERLLKLDP